MNAYALSIELEAIQSRTRKIIGISIAIHALILLWLMMYRTIAPPPPALTEISWIDPVTIQPPAVKATTMMPRQIKNFMPTPKQKPVHFVRKTNKSDFAPQPQDRRAVDDQLKSKLVTLERKSQKQTRITDLVTPDAVGKPSLASVPNEGSTGKDAVKLTRQQSTKLSPVRLTRSETKRTMPAMTLSKVPEKTVAPAKIEKAESTARRILDGASLVGPVADRPLISYEKPVYPEWAKSDGVEASVNLYFIVLPNGKVKKNILVQKTSGFQDFDRNAITALLAWKFEPLERGKTGEQWGSITFNYRLSDWKNR